MRLLRHETRTSARHLNYVYAELVWFGWIGIPGRHKVVGCKASNSAWVVRVAKWRLVGAKVCLGSHAIMAKVGGLSYMTCLWSRNIG